VSGGVALPLDVWAHVVLVRDTNPATGLLRTRIWVDGALTTPTDNQSALTNSNTRPVHLGIFDRGASAVALPLVGSLDEVAYWPGVALTVAQIGVLAASAAGTRATTTSAVSVVNRENIDPGRTAIYLDRDGVLTFGGILWDAKPNGGSLDISCAGFSSYLFKRILLSDRNYTGNTAASDQAQIVHDLVALAMVGAGNIGIIVPTVTLTGRRRARAWFGYEGNFMGEIISDLSDVIDGFDWGVVAEYDSSMLPSKTLRVWYPQRGRASGVIWRFGEGDSGYQAGTSLAAFEQPLSAGGMANQIVASGAGDGAAVLRAVVTDSNSLLSYPLYQDRIARKTVTVLDTLVDHGSAELGRTASPGQVATATLRPGHPDTDAGAWELGDVVTVQGSNGWQQIDSLFRIVGYATEYGTKEQTTVTLAPPTIY